MNPLNHESDKIRIKYLTLANLIRLVAIAPLVFASIAVFGLLEHLIGQDKSFDLLTISYQESELMAKRIQKEISKNLSQKMKQMTLKKKGTRSSSGIFLRSKKDFIKILGTITLKRIPESTLKNKIPKNANEVYFVDISGEIFALTPIRIRLKKALTKCRGKFKCYYLQKVNFEQIYFGGERKNSAILDYVVNRSGTLIYSSDPKISSFTFYKRDLVQKFIHEKSISKQINLQDQDGNKIYGYFHLISNTNLIHFREIPEKQILKPINEMSARFSSYFLGFVLFFLIIINPIVSKTVNPIKNLVNASQNVMQGNFTNVIPDSGFGEVSVLVNSYNQMGIALQTRDQEIRKLHVKEIERIRMENDLNVANLVQTNILDDSKKGGSDQIRVFYLPAEEVAGDWFGIHHNKQTSEHIAVVCDVSGHGLGSSMFTMVIAGVFHDYTNRTDGPFDFINFCQSVNDKFWFFGKGKWHTTFAGISFVPGSGVAHFYNAGHLHPLIATGDKVQAVISRSNILGLNPEKIKLAHLKRKYQPNDQVFIYTDGLIEIDNENRKQFGKKNLKKSIQKVMDSGNLSNFADSIMTDIRNYQAKDSKLEDDICLMKIHLI